MSVASLETLFTFGQKCAVPCQLLKAMQYFSLQMRKVFAWHSLNSYGVTTSPTFSDDPHFHVGVVAVIAKGIARPKSQKQQTSPPISLSQSEREGEGG